MNHTIEYDTAGLHVGAPINGPHAVIQFESPLQWEVQYEMSGPINS